MEKPYCLFMANLVKHMVKGSALPHPTQSAKCERSHLCQCHLLILCLESSFVVQLCTAAMGILADSSKTQILFMPLGELRSSKKLDLLVSGAGTRGLHYVLSDRVWPLMCIKSVVCKAGWSYENTGCTLRSY